MPHLTKLNLGLLLLVPHFVLVAAVIDCPAAEFITRATFAGANIAGVQDISSDGANVLWIGPDPEKLRVITDNQGIESWRFTQTPNTGGAFALDDAGDRVVAGDGLWQMSTGLQDMQGGITDISADGQTVVGTNDREAFLWTDAAGITPLPPLSGYLASEAWAVSADGRVIAGLSELDNSSSMTEATIWVRDNADGIETIGLGRPGGNETQALLLSADGSVVTGVSRSRPGAQVDTAFRWTEEEGIVELDLLELSSSSIQDMSSDGTIIVGRTFPVGIPEGLLFVWDEKHGTRELGQVLIEEHGFSSDIFPSEVDINFVTAISGDGTAVGGGYRIGDERTGWLALLDRPLGSPVLPGDYNNNGTVEQADLDLVLLHWGADATSIPDTWTNDLPIGAIDQNELDAVLLNWGNIAPVGAASVPEPSALMLIGIGILLLVRRTQQ